MQDGKLQHLSAASLDDHTGCSTCGSLYDSRGTSNQSRPAAERGVLTSKGGQQILARSRADAAKSGSRCSAVRSTGEHGSFSEHLNIQNNGSHCCHGNSSNVVAPSSLNQSRGASKHEPRVQEGLTSTSLPRPVQGGLSSLRHHHFPKDQGTLT